MDLGMFVATSTTLMVNCYLLPSKPERLWLCVIYTKQDKTQTQNVEQPLGDVACQVKADGFWFV